MGQGPLQVNQFRPAGNLSALDVTAAAVIKASAGTIMRIAVLNNGSAGSLTINDCLTTGAAAVANEVFTVGYAALAVGQIITLEFPMETGIVVSAVPTGGIFAIAYN